MLFSKKLFYQTNHYLKTPATILFSILAKVSLAVALLLFSGLTLDAKAENDPDTDRSTIRVLVNSEDDGTSVVGATVILTEQGADTLSAAVTDAYGFVEFSSIEPGNYDIHISFIGFQTNIEEVSLSPGETVIVRSELITSTAELDEVQVSAIRGIARREAGRQSISPQDINRIPTPGPGGDLTMYLQTLPSVVSTGDRGGELYIRGGTPAQSMVLVENMPIIKPFHISNLFSAFPQEVLSDVDVYAGGFGSEYAGATSSVLDVRLRQGNMRNFRSQAAASPYMVSFLAEGPVKRDEQSFMIMGRHSVIEDTGPSLIGEEVPLLFYDVLGRYSINWEGLTCNVTGIHTYDRGQINPVRSVELSWTNTTIGTRCLGYSEDLGHAVDFTFGYTGFNSTEKGIDNIGREAGIRKGFLRMDNGIRIFDTPGNYGFNLNFINYRAVLDEPFAEQFGREVRFAGLGSELNDVVVSLSTYFNLNWQPSRNFIITPGIASQIRLRDLSPTIEPRFRITWRPDGTEDKELTLALGRYVQMFDAINDERDAGTVFYVYKPIETGGSYPESLHAILGYRHQFSDRFGFSIEGYAKDHSNIPVARWTREAGNTLETGNADALTFGGDLQLEFNFYPFYMSVAYGLAKITYEAPSDELVAWIDDPIFSYNPAHDRRHQINLISTYSLRDYTFSVSWQFSSGGTFTRVYAYDIALRGLPDQNPLVNQGTAFTLFTEPFDGRMPSFNRMDVSVSRLFQNIPGVDIEAEIGAINSMDVRNVFYFDVNTRQQVDQMPFVPYAALTLKF